MEEAGENSSLHLRTEYGIIFHVNTVVFVVQTREEIAWRRTINFMC